jgi:hypothetical protein
MQKTPILQGFSKVVGSGDKVEEWIRLYIGISYSCGTTYSVRYFCFIFSNHNMKIFHLNFDKRKKADTRV